MVSTGIAAQANHLAFRVTLVWISGVQTLKTRTEIIVSVGIWERTQADGAQA